MSTNLLEDVKSVHEVGRVLGLRELASHVKGTDGKCSSLGALLRNLNVHAKATKGSNGNEGVPIKTVTPKTGYGLTYGQGDELNYPVWSLLKSEVTQSRFTDPKSPFGIIFGSFFVDTFKRIKLLSRDNKRQEFELCVDQLTRMISAMVTGRMDPQFYQDLRPGDTKRMVFMLRTTISLFCDKVIDILYPSGNMPLILLSQWARCVVDIVKLLRSLNQQCVQGFEYDIIRDIKVMIKRPLYTDLSLFGRTVKSLETVSDGIEIKQPRVSVNQNSLLVMSILLSEVVHEDMNGHVNGEACTINFGASCGSKGFGAIPVGLLSDKLAIEFLYRCLRMNVEGDHVLIVFIFLLKSYIFVKFGSFDIYTEDHFLKYLFGEEKAGSYNTNAFLEWVSKCRGKMHQHSDYECMIILELIHLLNEMLYKNLKEYHASNDIYTNTYNKRVIFMRDNVKLLNRIIFMIYLDYFRYKMGSGVLQYDSDNFERFYQFWIVLINNIPSLSNEMSDISTSILILCSRFLGNKNLLWTLPSIFVSEKILDADYDILTIDSLSYTNCKAIVMTYLENGGSHTDFLNLVYTELSKNLRVDSFRDARMSQLGILFKIYSTLVKRDIGCFRPEILTPSRSQGDNPIAKTSCGVSNEGYDQCFLLEPVNDNSICLICLCVEVVLLYMDELGRPSNDEIKLCFTFLNSLLVIMIDIDRILKYHGKSSNEHSDLLVLVLETFFHMQIKDVSQNVGSEFKNAFCRILSICDVIFELITNKFLESEFVSVEMFNDPTPNSATPEYSMVNSGMWLSLILLLRAIISSPIKPVHKVVNSLIFFCKHNASMVDSAKGKAHRLRNSSHKQVFLTKTSEMRRSVERLITHAFARYLTHVIISLAETDDTLVIDEYIDGLIKTVLLYISTVVFDDDVYGIVALMPTIVDLAIVADPKVTRDDEGFIKFLHSYNRLVSRKHGVVNSIPFISDVNALSLQISVDEETRETLEYTKEVPLFSLSPSKFCFICGLSMIVKSRTEYTVTCQRCGSPSPLVPSGRVNLKNLGSTIFVSSSVLTATTFPDTTFLPIMGHVGGEIVQYVCKNLLDVLVQTVGVFSELQSAEGVEKCPRSEQEECARSEQEATRMLLENASDLLSLFTTINGKKDEVMERMNGLVPKFCRFGHLLCVACLSREMEFAGCFSLEVIQEFFKTRFSECSLLFVDSTKGIGEVKLQYLYDYYILSILGAGKALHNDHYGMNGHYDHQNALCSDKDNLTGVKMENYSGNNEQSLHHTSSFIHSLHSTGNAYYSQRAPLINLSIQTISELFIRHLETIEPCDIASFSEKLIRLSRFSNLFSIPLNRLVTCGLCITVLDKAERASFKFKRRSDAVSSIYNIILNKSAFSSLNTLFNMPLRQIIPHYQTIFGTVEYNDYTLFRILFNMEEVSKAQNLDMQKIHKFKFYAFIRLLWFTTNPHVVVKLLFAQDFIKGEPIKDGWQKGTRSHEKFCDRNKNVLELQSNYVVNTFSAYLKLQRLCLDISPDASSGSNNGIESHSVDPSISQLSTAKSLNEHDNSPTNRHKIYEFMEGNFIRILNLFVTTWFKEQHVSFSLKNKRIFYPEIYLYGKQGREIQRIYNCIALIMKIYNGDLDAFCDRIIEALTICNISEFNKPLLECWIILSRKLSLPVLCRYSPGIVYQINKISKFDKDRSLSNIIYDVENEIKDNLMRANATVHSQYVASIMGSLTCTWHHLKCYASMIYSSSGQKNPYITREAAAFAASEALSRNPFIINDDECKESASDLAYASLATIYEYSDDLAKSPTSLTVACCKILGYLHFDLQTFHMDKGSADILRTDNSLDLSIVLLTNYLIPNMHMPITSYCIQEVLKFLGFHNVDRATASKNGMNGHAHIGDGKHAVKNEKCMVKNEKHALKEDDGMESKWKLTFEHDVQQCLEPYRSTNFLRNKQIEDAIECQLEANTVLDIKCFVWWLLKMLPDSCLNLPLFKACDLAMVQIPAVLSFLLPYIISSCVRYLDTQDCVEIGKRMAMLLCNILQKDSSTFGINWKSSFEKMSAQEASSFELHDHYTSCQAIFNLIDQIRFMVDKGSHLFQDSSDKEFIALIISRFKSILSAIPNLLVAHAAISCGSYARGVMIIEHELTYRVSSYDFSNPIDSLGNVISNYNVSQAESLNSRGIISLLCRGYGGLSELDALICISSFVKSTNTWNAYSLQSVEDDVMINKRDEICKAFSLECKGMYRQAYDIYNTLLKESQDSKLWTCWYRIVQLLGPNSFVKFPKIADHENISDSLFAESATACWKLSLWDELDEILSKHKSARNLDTMMEIDAILEQTYTCTSPRELDICTQNQAESFWTSLLMRDSVDVWFMERVASSLSLIQKFKYEESLQIVDDGLNHLVRPLGLAIHESTQVGLKYLEKIAIFNTLNIVLGFYKNGEIGEDDEKAFAKALIKKAQTFANNRCNTLLNILGTAKVALELGGRMTAASTLLIHLNRTCRLNDVKIHIPGSISLSNIIPCLKNEIIIENALTLHKNGDVEGDIQEISRIDENDFEGFYNLVKIYSESNLLISKIAVSYMHQVLELAPSSFKANLLYANYLDRLIDGRIRNSQNIKVIKSEKGRGRKKDSSTIAGIEGIPGMFSFVELVGMTVGAYLQSLRYVDSPDTDDDSMEIVDILTKVVTIMCFYCTPNMVTNGINLEDDACELFFRSIHERVVSHGSTFPHYYWYSVLSQLVSRCQHKLLGATIFQNIIANLISKYPKQTLWSTLYFGHSLSSKRRKVHTEIVQLAINLNGHNDAQNDEYSSHNGHLGHHYGMNRRRHENINDIIECYDSVFREMHNVALNRDIQISEKSATKLGIIYKLMNDEKLRGIVLIPTKEQLSFEHLRSGGVVEEVHGMSETIQVLRSKQKPKRIALISNTGRLVNFLIKNEIKGDLRKDMRMMEATTYISRMINYTDVKLQSYSVVPLSEVSGIIEFVSNMCTLRALVNDEMRKVLPNVEGDTKGDINKYSQAVSDKRYSESLSLFGSIAERRPPVLHRVHFKLFRNDPAVWYNTRRQYILSAAMWNIFGYIVGLGDRHAENILFNVKTGQIMHVDFDCLFGKGTTLLIPELVPFRLTQNIVCNLGVCGTCVDGPYYSESLKFLKMLHKNQKRLTSVLMSFVFDPLIEWDGKESEQGGLSQKVLQTVQDKLRGIVNVIIPSVEIARNRTTEKGKMFSDHKSFEMIAEPLEPKQQLQQLINAAMSPAHLSKMFVGWAPWL